MVFGSAASWVKQRAAFKANPARDVFLISYPRSGNTWIRSVLYNMITGQSAPSLSDLDYVIPDIHFATPRWKMRKLPYYVVKTHDSLTNSHYTDRVTRGIFIVRNPFDVCLSYWRYLSCGVERETDFFTYVEDFFAGRIWPGHWAVHTMTWTDCRKELLTLRYEDLIDDQLTTVRKINDYLELGISEKALSAILRDNDKSRMSEKEKRGNRKEYAGKSNFFIGQGAPEDLKEALERAPAYVQFRKTFAGTLARYGY